MLFELCHPDVKGALPFMKSLLGEYSNCAQTSKLCSELIISLEEPPLEELDAFDGTYGDQVAAV